MIKIAKDEEINRLFYEKHWKPTDIAKQIEVNKSYVTKVIQKDERYVDEKEKRKNESKERHKASKRNYINKKRQSEKQEYEAMLVQINKDNEQLSKKKKLSDEEFAKWNRGMFEYDKNSSDLVIKKGINVGYNVPKRVRKLVNVSSF